MRFASPSKSRKQLFHAGACVACVTLFTVAARGQTPATPPPASMKISQESGPPKRIPRQQALTTAALDGVVREKISDSAMRPVVAARIHVRNLQTGQESVAVSSGDGLFRIFPLAPGGYEMRVEASGYAAFQVLSVTLNANEVLTLEIYLSSETTMEKRSRLPRHPDLGPPLASEAQAGSGSYLEFRHRL